MFSIAYRHCAPVLALVAGITACSGIGSTGSALPSAMAQTNISAPPAAVGIRRLALDQRIMPAAKPNLIYASNTSGNVIDAWPNPDNGNAGPSCAVGTPSQSLSDVTGFGVDPSGYVIAPGVTSIGSSVSVWKPDCGALVWQAAIPNGWAANDAYSNDAAAGPVVVSVNGFAKGMVICQPSGCGTPITSAAITIASGVVQAKNGSCWLQGTGQQGYVLFYFRTCSGSPEVTTGTVNASGYGLFIDTHGHLGSIDPNAGMLYVYSGCKPKCTLLSQSTLMGTPGWGGLDAKGENLVVGDPSDEAIDVYSYNASSGATYSYSITNSVGNDWGAQFVSRNKKT